MSVEELKSFISREIGEVGEQLERVSHRLKNEDGFFLPEYQAAQDALPADCKGNDYASFRKL